ncbi:MAG: DUF4835 family protein [Saprospiraceae bacterium]|jgi:hypothetical protein|nr:DUF4835 family protein [Saprospiraceae bacterium]
MKNIFLISFLLGTGFFRLFAQELNIKVSVVTQGSINSLTNDATLFKDLEKNISEFLNTTKWTDDEYQLHEKIRGSIQLTITEEVQANIFKAELVLQTERPVYNSIYSSPLINLIDKNVSFTFNGLQPLLKTTNTFYDNLSSILSFYVYYMMGIDYDSFSLNGGEPHFLKAQEIITSLPSNYVRDDGWKNDGGSRRNRYWLIENILNPRMRQFRQAFYEYHRLSLDKMYDESDKSRAVMLSALTSIGQANLEYPNTYLIQMFGDAKKDEVVEIFKLGDKGQKIKVKGIMVGMDASKTEKYSVLN